MDEDERKLAGEAYWAWCRDSRYEDYRIPPIDGLRLAEAMWMAGHNAALSRDRAPGEAERLKEALEFYAEPKNHDDGGNGALGWFIRSPVETDRGARAREALAARPEGA